MKRGDGPVGDTIALISFLGQSSGMGQILIRNLDDSVIAGLKRRAMENRTSAEEEGRRALTASVSFDVETWIAEARALRDEVGPLPGPSSTELLRADRDRDNDR